MSDCVLVKTGPLFVSMRARSEFSPMSQVMKRVTDVSLALLSPLCLPSRSLSRLLPLISPSLSIQISLSPFRI